MKWVEISQFWIFNNPVIKQAVKIFHVPRVWRKPRSGLRAAAAGGARRAKPAAQRAFYNGIVKNQQGWAAEVWQTGSGEKFALLNF
jgi:hypothetical protein